MSMTLWASERKRGKVVEKEERQKYIRDVGAEVLMWQFVKS